MPAEVDAAEQMPRGAPPPQQQLPPPPPTTGAGQQYDSQYTGAAAEAQELGENLGETPPGVGL